MSWLVLSLLLALSLSAVTVRCQSSDGEASEHTEAESSPPATENTPEESAADESSVGGDEEAPPPEAVTPEEEKGEEEEEKPSDFKRTVILIHAETRVGEEVYIRGGIDHDRRQGCGNEGGLDADPCSIKISNRKLDIEGDTPARNAWAEGDTHLDWYGPEEGQGEFAEIPSRGTAAQWTTNDVNSEYHSPLNTFGHHYWLVDFDMDCSQTVDGFFEFKAMVNSNWEPIYSRLDVRCQGDEGKDLPYQADNHFAQCGFVNVHEWGHGQCQVLSFEEDQEREELAEEEEEEEEHLAEEEEEEEEKLAEEEEEEEEKLAEEEEEEEEKLAEEEEEEEEKLAEEEEEEEEKLAEEEEEEEEKLAEEEEEEEEKLAAEEEGAGEDEGAEEGNEGEGEGNGNAGEGEEEGNEVEGEAVENEGTGEAEGHEGTGEAEGHEGNGEAEGNEGEGEGEGNEGEA